MLGFSRNVKGQACLSGTSLVELIAAARTGTPAYVYDVDAVAESTRRLVASMGDSRHIVAYALKANSAGTVVRAVASAGAGADVVSGAELEVARGCGVPPERIVMSGVGKTDAELDLAIRSGILAIQAESVEELARVAARARALSTRARVALRINPSVMADTHSHVATGHDEAKFGIALTDLGAAWERIDGAPEQLDAVGVSAHVGSNLASPEPYRKSARAVCAVAKARAGQGKPLSYVDFGGGFGIDYGTCPVVAPEEFVRDALSLLKEEALDELQLVVEPGRAVVGPHGVLVARVVQSKRSGRRQWIVLDAGMNDLLRPALYQAHHRVEPLEHAPGGENWRVVGPICESADDFGSHPLGAEPPAAVVVRDAGAYGFSMASQYNGRALPSEVFVASGQVNAVSQSAGAVNWVRSRLSA